MMKFQSLGMGISFFKFTSLLSLFGLKGNISISIPKFQSLILGMEVSIFKYVPLEGFQKWQGLSSL